MSQTPMHTQNAPIEEYATEIPEYVTALMASLDGLAKGVSTGGCLIFLSVDHTVSLIDSKCMQLCAQTNALVKENAV